MRKKLENTLAFTIIMIVVLVCIGTIKTQADKAGYVNPVDSYNQSVSSAKSATDQPQQYQVIIPQAQTSSQSATVEVTTVTTTVVTTTTTAYSNDVCLLAKVIQCEAGNQDIAGKLAVATVIMNRVQDGSFGGSTVEGVVYKKNAFSCVNTALWDRQPTSEDLAIAADVINNSTRSTVVGNRLYYSNLKVCSGTPGIVYDVVIGDHSFGN